MNKEYKFNVYKTIKIYKINNRRNKNVLIITSGGAFPTFTNQINLLSRHLKLNYSRKFDIYVLSSNESYIKLFFDKTIEQCLTEGFSAYDKHVFFCYCSSCSIMTNVLYNMSCTFRHLNRELYERWKNVHLISFNSIYDNYKMAVYQHKRNIPIAYQLMIGYTTNDKYAALLFINKLKFLFNILPNSVDAYIENIACDNNTTQNKIKKAMRINTKFEYKLHVIQITTPIANLLIPQKINYLHRYKAFNEGKACVTEHNIPCLYMRADEINMIINNILQTIVNL